MIQQEDPHQLFYSQGNHYEENISLIPSSLPLIATLHLFHTQTHEPILIVCYSQSSFY